MLRADRAPTSPAYGTRCAMETVACIAATTRDATSLGTAMRHGHCLARTASPRAFDVIPMKHPVLAALLFAPTFLCSAAVAQLPDWVTRTTSSPTMLWAESTIVVVEDGSGLHAFSSYTRTWSDLTVSASRNFYGYDDHCVVVDGNTAWAFTSRTAHWTSQPLSGAPLVVAPNSGAVWVTALIDGLRAHVFSSLLGNWSSADFTATPNARVGRMVAVLSDGQKTVAFSAHFGTPVVLGLGGVSNLTAVGCCGAARTNGWQHVFSAYRNRWRSLPASASSTLVTPPSRAGYLVIREANSMNFYSALTDNQVVLFHSPNATLQVQEDVAAVSDGTTLFAYSCAAGTIDAVTTATSWQTVDVKRGLIVANDGTAVSAFGLVEGRFAPPLPGSYSVTANTGVALAMPLGSEPCAAFSCMTNSWATMPPGTYVGAYTTFNAAVLYDVTGQLHGFGANHAQWSSTQIASLDAAVVSQAMFCARDGNRLLAFNGRDNAWVTTTTAATANITCFDMAVLADDGQQVYAYGVYQPEWSAHACQSTQQQLRDECAWVFDGSVVHVWSGSSQVSEWSNMPEYWRLCARGGRLAYTLSAEPGSVTTLAVGLLPTHLATPFGTLLVDPAAAAFATLPIPANGATSLQLTVPDVPSLRGVTLYAQGIVFDPTTMAVYLTDGYQSTIV